MQDKDKTREQLIAELHELHQRLAESEKDKAEHKRAEQALKESEEMFRAIFDHLRDGLLLADKETRQFLMSNPAIHEMLGYSAEELKQLGVADIHPEQDLPWVVNQFEELAKGAIRIARDVPARRKDGSVFHVDISASFPMIFNGKMCLMGVFRDISERKRMEQTLKENEERYRLMAENIEDVFWIATPDIRKMLYISPAYERIWGRSCESLYESPRSWLDAVHPEDRDRVLDTTERHHLLGTAWSVAYRIICPDGTTRWIEDRGFPVPDEEGNLYLNTGIAIDITERVQQEQEIRLLNRLYTVLSKVSQAVVRATSPKAFLDEACHVIVEEGGFLLSWIGQVEAETNAVAPVAIWGKAGDYARGITIYADDRPEGRGPTGACIRERRPSVHNDFMRSPPTQPWRERAAPFGICASAAFPIVSAGQVWGALTICADEVGFFGEKDVKLLEKVAGDIGFALDNLEKERQRSQAEAALRNSEHRLSQIVEFLPDATFVIDKQGEVIAWNQAMEAMTGVRSEDMIGKGNLEYAIPFYGERRPILIDLALLPRPEMEEKYTGLFWKGDILFGETFVSNLPWGKAHLSATAAVLRDAKGEVVAAIECLRDNTERKQMEEKLQETRDFLENLLDYANAPIIVWDSRFKITRFNRAFERLTGRKSSDVLGLGLDFLFPPDKRTESLEYIHRTSFGERWETVEIPIQHTDGRVRTLLWNSATLYGTDGVTVVATIAQGHDITEWRQAQEEQRQLGAQLAQAQKMEAIGTLAGGIAHDFNNILGIIMGYAEIAELHLVKDSPAKRGIDEVLKAAYRAKDLVKQILTFSRKGEQERKPMQIIPVIVDALKLLRASLPTTIEIRPEIGLSPGDDLILGDLTQVQQILMNLSTNAAHAMRERGGALRVALSPVHFGSSDDDKPLELSPGNYLKLTVEDSGHGMDQTTIDHIFDPFFTTKGPGEGTGLGLAVVHGIVNSHGGAITVSSRMGEGTAFHVYLPKLETGDTSKTEAIAELPKGSERILLVDDEELLANAVKQLLEYLGYRVTAATSSAEALLVFRRQPEDFDLVITDYTMPKMTGAELAEQIVQIRSDIPIILCTGFNERINEEGARKAGICAFLMKPGSLEDFALLVRKVLKTRES